MTTPSRLQLLKAMVTVLAADTTRPCKLGAVTFVLDAQQEPTDVPDLPCTVVYGGAGMQLDGPGWGDANADGWMPVLVRSVARQANQVEWMADRARSTILSTVAGGGFRVAIPVTGYKVGGRELDSSGPAQPEGDAWNLTDTFKLWMTPDDTPPDTP